MKTIKKICQNCGGQNLKIHLSTYPVKMGDKQLNVGRVSIKEYLVCHFLMPTKAGQDEIGRCMIPFMSLLGDD